MAVVGTGLSFASMRGEFMNAMAQVQTYWQDLCTQIASTTQLERYRWLGTVPQMREWGTGRLAKGLRSESYDVENQEYEATIEVDRKEIEDDQLGGIRTRILELASRAATHKDYLLEALLDNGGSPGYVSYDGITFFNDAHVSGLSGEQDNDLTFDMSGAAPTTEEFKKSMIVAMQKMLGYKDDAGVPLRIGPTGLVAIVPPALLFTALEAINATLVSSTTNVLANNTLMGAARVIALPGLSSDLTWYLAKTNMAVGPFICQDRMPIEFGALEENSETGFTKGVFLYGVRARYTIAYAMWQHCVRTLFN